MKFLRFAPLIALVLGLAQPADAQQPGASEAAPKKVLRVSYRSSETSFDPAKISDLYSRDTTQHIFEAPYRYDPLARPAKVRPLTAEGMPVGTPDFKTWTVKIRPGIYFADDPAFKGKKRELTAQDYVYAYLRVIDPANKSPSWGGLEAGAYVGVVEARKAAIASQRGFDYDQTIEGIRALDRYTLQFRFKEPRPRFAEGLTASDIFGGQAREVVEFYGEQIDAHPVGTGAFRLKQWRRNSLIVLERNPDYRDVRYDGEPAADDAEGQAILARLKGRRLPMVDEVHISIIEESQPRWLSFLNADIDLLGTLASPLPSEFVPQAIPNGQLAPNLARRGVGVARQLNADTTMMYFNMDDPLVGGYTPERVALRRAISLGQNIEAIIGIYRGEAIPAQSPISPHTTGYDPAFKSEMSDYNPARAKALLDLFGYVDRNGDGWREQPDGKPLVIERATQPDQIYREFDTVWKKDMNALGIRTVLKTNQWPENLKAARAGKLQVWSVGSSASDPDGQGALWRLHGPQAGGQNLARFRNAEFDAMFDRMQALPDGPERDALFRQAKLIAVAYMPYRNLVHRVSADLWHPWVIGFRRAAFASQWYQSVDIDPSKRPAR
jgi:ABC-type transport system substrate-binding protein